MENLLTRAIEQVPGLGVMVLLVWMFLKHLKGYSQVIREMNKENIEARQHSRDVIEKNTDALSRNTEAMRDMTHIFMNRK